MGGVQVISLKNDKIYTLVNNVVLLEKEGSTSNNNNNASAQRALAVLFPCLTLFELK